MQFDQDRTVTPLLQAQLPPRALAALMLKLPRSGDAAIDAMIRQARTIDLAEALTVAQAGDPAAQKDLSRVLQRNLIIAQQMEAALEKIGNPDVRAAA